jgi:hypothetical protein
MLATAALKFTGLGSSAMTFQPVSAKLVFSSTARSSFGPKASVASL